MSCRRSGVRPDRAEDRNAPSRMLRHCGRASPNSSAGMIRIRFEGCALSPALRGHPQGNASVQNAKDLPEVWCPNGGESRTAVPPSLLGIGARNWGFRMRNGECLTPTRTRNSEFGIPAQPTPATGRGHHHSARPGLGLEDDPSAWMADDRLARPLRSDCGFSSVSFEESRVGR